MSKRALARSSSRRLKQSRLDGVILTESNDRLYFDLLPYHLRFFLACFCVIGPLDDAYYQALEMKRNHFHSVFGEMRRRCNVCAPSSVVELKLQDIINAHSRGHWDSWSFLTVINRVSDYNHLNRCLIIVSSTFGTVSPYTFAMINEHRILDLYVCLLRLKLVERELLERMVNGIIRSISELRLDS
jgi:hypothetical protein